MFESISESEGGNIDRKDSEFDQLMYVLTHDFKAAFRSVYSLSDWIRSDLEPHLTPQTRSYFELLQARVRSLNSALEELHAFLRADREPLHMGKIDIRAMMDEIVLAAGLPDTCRIEIGLVSREMTGDRERMGRIFGELIDHAFRNLPEGRGCIEIEQSEIDEGIRFEIRNSGPPIGADSERSLFWVIDPGVRTHPGKGMITGLAYSKKLVESIGGRIGVVRDVRGSTGIRMDIPGLVGKGDRNEDPDGASDRG